VNENFNNDWSSGSCAFFKKLYLENDFTTMDELELLLAKTE